MTRTGLLVPALALAAACSSSHDAPPADAAGPGPDAPLDAGSDTTCARTAAAADRPRHIVVAHPFGPDTGSGSPPSGAFEVLDLTAAGTITRAQHTFTMGPTSFGTIAFTQDGRVGVVADDRGKLGVFTLADDGTATVVASQLVLPYYAGKLVMDPSGGMVWVIDGDTGSNGGGIYRVDLACDGTPTDRGLVAAGSTPGGLAFSGDRAIVAAGAMLDSPAHTSAHLLAWGATPTRIASADGFGDDMASIGGTALTADGSTYLIGDTSGFASVPNRIAVVGVSETGLKSASVIPNVNDPEGIVASPFGNVAVATDAFGNAIHILDDSGSGGTWRVRGDVAYATGTSPPQLPGDVATIAVGMLRGHVFISEVDKVRQLAFDATGAVTDLGSLKFGDAVEEALGAIGVTP